MCKELVVASTCLKPCMLRKECAILLLQKECAGLRVNKTRTWVLFQEYFELQHIYKQILNRIKIPIFSSEFVHE